MSEKPEVMLSKILETFVKRVDALHETLIKLDAAITNLNASNQAIIEKLDALRLELRELSTRIEVAMRR